MIVHLCMFINIMQMAGLNFKFDKGEATAYDEKLPNYSV